MVPELGIVEGFFGPTWSWDERRRTMRALAPHGYRFYLYAPKADAHLRRAWREPHPESVARELAAFGADCHSAGVRFGVGLTPFEAHFGFDAATRTALAERIAALDALGLDDLAILFDDMRGEVPDLAARQVEIAHFAASRTRARRVLVCPSYYSDDPVLDRVFGARPPEYLRSLGRLLDARIEVFWTGEEVCSREYSVGHLEDVAAQLGRKPFLWDNYPVNDGPRMSPHLHLRAFTGRPGAIAHAIAGHAINPALQPTLTCVPALTLAASYREGAHYRYGRALDRALREVAGPELGALLRADLLSLQDAGLDGMTAERRAKLHERYAAVEHPAAREVVRWLEGGYGVDAETVRTQ